MNILVCGGAGFIGSAFIRNHLENSLVDKIINIDNLSIGSNLINLKTLENNDNYRFVEDNIRNLELVKNFVKEIDLIINFAAETHVDRSIANPLPFIETNVLGTYSLLEATRIYDKMFVHVSTDEVYGNAENQKSFSEQDILTPSNPYSATKASADHLVLSYHKTYGIKCMITRCTNNFGPFQFPEKLIPKTIIRALKDLKIPLHGGGYQTRDWICVLDHVRAIESLLLKGKSGEIYNISGSNEIETRAIVEKILKFMDKPFDLMESIGDRPGQDKRYSLDSSKIRKVTGWKPKYEFNQALEETITWYLQNSNWWEPLADEKTLHPQPWLLDWN